MCVHNIFLSYEYRAYYRCISFCDTLRTRQIDQIKFRVDHGALVQVLTRDGDADARMRPGGPLVHGVTTYCPVCMCLNNYDEG
jgi:hypothetical protein